MRSLCVLAHGVCMWRRESGNKIEKESHDFRYLIVEQIIMCIDTNNERPEHELALEQLHGQ